MKILAVSDEECPALWDHYVPGRLADYDLILACGDLKSSYLTFLVTMSRARLLYIHGNHDGSYESMPPEGCDDIDGRLVVYNGVRILGLGGCLRYPPGPYQYTERQMGMRILRLAPSLVLRRGFDILLTHAPALGVGDDDDLAHRGFACFLRLMDRYHPALMAHGHVHKNYRFDFRHEREYHGTKVVNACGSYVFEWPPAT